MNSAFAPLLDVLRSFLIELVKDSLRAVLAEQAKQPRYPERVTVQTAAEITGYSVNSLYQMHSKNQVPGALKVGRKLMFDTAALQRWVEEGCVR